MVLKLGVLVLLVFGIVCCFTCSQVSANEYENNNIQARGFDAKSILTSIATNLMSRGYGTTGVGSQALIFAAASLAGHKGEHYARNLDGEEKLLSDEEVLMFLSYLTGSPGDNGCLQNIACQQPNQAKKYVNAGDVLLKAAKMFSMKTDDTYDYVLKEVDHAANVGIAGGNCQIFQCSDSKKS